ncbi:hypothetical protein EYF80_015320 [Liparis tanakae]|uniref:Uncharacterized protein n=1 Tax=Liparis tanakae TaxID=230148 RepID=A0A4Z2I9I9_9TELE|nr:hypothetical protein EYF80_015320 [Liparis tanakae]
MLPKRDEVGGNQLGKLALGHQLEAHNHMLDILKEEATRSLAVHGYLTATSKGARVLGRKGAREPCGRAGSRCVGGFGQSSRQQRREDGHTGRRAEPEWALLGGFFRFSFPE